MGQILDNPPQPRRRWYQYRLRSLLMLTTIVCVVLGWVMNERRMIAARRIALEEMEARFEEVQPQPPWRVWLLGDDEPVYAHGLFLSISYLKNGDAKYITDDDLAHLSALAQLRVLTLRDSDWHFLGLPDAPNPGPGLKYLRRLVHLERLSLEGTKISDADLEHLKTLSELEYLSLERTAITGKGLVHLTGLTKMKGLNLGGTKISGADLVHLQWFPQLEVLNLLEVATSGDDLQHLSSLIHLRSLELKGIKDIDGGLAHLKCLPQLAYLRLDESQLTDGGLAHICEFTQLTHLSARSTRITDVGLVQLKQLPNLKFIDVSRTRVTDEGLAELKISFPNIEIKNELFVPDSERRRVTPNSSVSAVPSLIMALKHDDIFVRLEAAEALGQVGPAAKDAVPELTAAVKNFKVDEALAYEADRALQKILPGTPSILEGK